jgi:hypothetical protein
MWRVPGEHNSAGYDNNVAGYDDDSCADDHNGCADASGWVLLESHEPLQRNRGGEL